MPPESRNRVPPLRWVVGTVAVLGALVAAASVVPRRWMAAMRGSRSPSAEQEATVGQEEHTASATAPVPTPPETHENVPDEEALLSLAYHTEPPTYWPVAVALGFTLAMLGIIVSVTFIAVGGLVMVVGLIGWIGDVVRG